MILTHTKIYILVWVVLDPLDFRVPLKFRVVDFRVP